MDTIELKDLKDKYIKDIVEQKIAIMLDNKSDTEMLIEKFIPDYFEYKYKLSNNNYLLVFTKNWLTKEDSLLVYDLDAEFRYIDENKYKMELTEKNLIKWLNTEVGYSIEKILLFK